jgi:hypothetical protein
MAKGLHVWDLGTCCTPGAACGWWYPMLGSLSQIGSAGVYDPQYQIGNEVLWQDLGSPSPGDFTSIYGGGTCVEYLGKIPLEPVPTGPPINGYWNAHSIMPNWFNTWPPNANKYTSCDCGGGIPGAPPQEYDMHAYECICPQAGGAPGFANTNGCCGWPPGHEFVMGYILPGGAGSTLGNLIPLNDSFYSNIGSPNPGDTFTVTMPPGNSTCMPCFRYLGTRPAYGTLNAPTSSSTFNNPNIHFIGITGNPTIIQTSNYNLVDDCNCIPDIVIDPNDPGETALQPGLHLWTKCLDCEQNPQNWIDEPEECCPLTKLRSYFYIAAWEPQHFFQVPGSNQWHVDALSPTSPVPHLWEMCSTRARRGAELFWQILGSPSIGETRRLYHPPYLGAIGMDGYVHNMNDAPLHKTTCIRYVGMKQCATQYTYGQLPYLFDLVDGHPWIDVTCEHKWGTMSTDLGGGTSGIPEQFESFPGPCCPPPVPNQPPIELLPIDFIHATGSPIGGGVVVGGLDPSPCPPQDINSPYYTNAPEFCEGCLPGGYYQMHPDCQCCDIDLNPANPYVVQDKTIKIINNNLDRAINEAKIRGLIDENVPSSRVMKELEAAVLAIPNYFHENNDELIEEEGPIAKKKKKKFPKPPKWLRCKGCGGGFGVCILGGCFSGWKWTWPV